MRKVMRVQTFLVTQRQEIVDLFRSGDREFVSQEFKKNRIIVAYAEPMHWTEQVRFKMLKVKRIVRFLKKRCG